MTDWIGQTLGDYEVLALIGEGAMGPVYRARDRRLDRLVALRLPPPHLVGDSAFLARFRREAAAVTQFAHKNIVQVYDIGDYHRMPFIVAELVDGESLAQRLARKGTLPAPDALAIILYGVKALANAWSAAQLCHLDLKPASLLIARDGEIKLSDLGRARSPQDTAPQPAATGDAARYASPELAGGTQPPDLRADIYSLGGMLFEMITGRVHVCGAPVAPEALPAGCPPALAQLLAAMLAPDRDQRPASYDALQQDLWQLDQHLLAAAPAPLLLPSPDHRRARGLWLGLASLVLVLFAAALTWSVLKTRHVFDHSLKPLEHPLTNAVPHPAAPKAKPKPQPVAPAQPVREFRQPALPHAQWRNARDLLALVEPKRDALSGKWSREAGALLGEAHRGAAQLEIPYEPPAEYDFRVEFSVDETGIGGGQQLTAAGHDFWWLFFVGPASRLCGFDLVGGSPVYQNPTRNMLSAPEKGRRYVSLVEVRRNGVRAFLDDALVAEHKTDFHDMSLAPRWKPHGAGRLGLTCTGPMVFHRVELREVSGGGRVAQPSAPPPDPFLAEVAALTASAQVQRVVAKLQELNPGYDGTESHEIENGKVVVLALASPAITKLGPVRALTALQNFQFGNTDELNGPRYPLADLRPLAGLPLTALVCNRTEVSDLAPLRNMALTNLKCSGSPIRDLNVLRGMSLLELDCRRTAVRDLGPLRKMPLHYLYCDVTVATNGPNRGVIRSLEPTLKEINGRVPADFWKQPCDYTPPTGTPVIRRD
jgi:serine/threonine protein kinase